MGGQKWVRERSKGTERNGDDRYRWGGGPIDSGWKDRWGRRMGGQSIYD